jgi:hypothetical protein
MAPTDKVTSKRLRAMVGTVYISTTYNLILGMNGEDATEATSGKDAPMVHIDLSRPRNHTTSSAVCVKIQNTPKHPHETDTKYFHDLHKNGMIHVSACGGRGGNGGSGGDGQNGQRGRKGRDASSVCSGSNGGNGGNGGSGGNGTSGGNGGRGGNIKISVKEEDCDLLLALSQPIVSGGRGGTAGRNGRGGSGGFGGAGGDSYSE